MITYSYNEKIYTEEGALRNAIFEKDRIAFGPEPQENKAEFWESFGVAYREEADPEPTLDELKAQKLRELDRAFSRWRNSDATLISSLGFVVDADERAMIDVSGLVALGGGAVFMDADNVPHQLTASEIKTLQAEIIQSGNRAYMTKWTFRGLIEGAESAEGLDAIDLKFIPSSFAGGDA